MDEFCQGCGQYRTDSAHRCETNQSLIVRHPDDAESLCRERNYQLLQAAAVMHATNLKHSLKMDIENIADLTLALLEEIERRTK